MKNLSRLLVVATSIFFPLPAFAAGDEVSPLISILAFFLFGLPFYLIGQIIGASFRLFYVILAFTLFNVCLVLISSMSGGFEKVIERSDVVLTFLAILNLLLVLGFLVGRGKFRDLFVTFKKKVL
jgi:hypothetical protein